MLKLVTIAFLLGLQAVNATAAESVFYFYDQNGEAVEYEALEQLVAVRLDPDAPLGSAQDFALSRPELIDTIVATPIGNQTYIFSLEEGISLEDVLVDFQMYEEVWMVNPVLIGVLGDTIRADNRLLAVINQSSSQSDVDSVQGLYGVESVRIIDDSLRIEVLEVAGYSLFDILGVARALYSSGLYYSVEPDFSFRAIASVNDPYYIHQWQFENIGQSGGTIDADADWEEASLYNMLNLSPPRIALIDMGFQMTHEDLEGQVIGVGYDAAGWDINNFDIYGPDFDPTNDCSDSELPCWHGTAVLGVFDATTNNSTGLAGFENQPAVIPVKMADHDGNTRQAIFTDALNWARGPHGPIRTDVVCITVNNSTLASPASDFVLHEMYKSGKPVICSAGNSSPALYPATSPYVLAVGMTDHNDNVLAAGVGPSLDVVAPGVQVWSLDLMGDDGLSKSGSALCDNNPNYNCYMYGTSFSAPLVAGIAAKILMRDPLVVGPPQARDSAEIIYDIIRYSSSRTQYGASAYDTSRVNHTVGWGRVNASRALLSVAHGDANNDALITIGDAVFIINYIFADGPGPSPHLLMGDADGSGGLSIGDAVYVINHVFGGGPAPRISYYYSE